MNWIQNLQKAIQYIESHLTDDIKIDDVAAQIHTSSTHFQMIFHIVMGITIGEYIRNRRLSLAAQDLLQPDSRIIGIAMRYHYSTPESFSKAFTRFHGVSPSKVQQTKQQCKQFAPLCIHITVQGGFEMSHTFADDILFLNWIEIQKDKKLSSLEAYNRLVNWASQARRQNPGVFDALSEWILDDSQWSEEKLAENEQILMHGVLARFKEQNAKLREYLKELEPSGVVNQAVFKALNRFDDELSGQTHDERLQETVAKIFADFSTMRKRSVREKIAGHVKESIHMNDLGYINYLKDCDASVQWTLFMPRKAESQQKGFKVDSFEYKTMPAMRFIGREGDDTTETIEGRKALFNTLDKMDAHKSGFDHDILLMHHYGRGVDIEPWHGFWGRFMKPYTPVPEGFVYWDFVPDNSNTPYLTFRSQFALATFAGDADAMHKRKGYDSDAMYDVTRNIILGQSVTIPYPEIYWTAEVFLDGYDKPGTAYMFSVALD